MSNSALFPQRRRWLAAVLPALLGSAPVSAYQVTDQFEISGFSRVIAGYLDDADNRIVGYKDELSVGEQSLLALQPTYTFNEQWSVTAQLLAHSSEDRDSGIEWLYLAYRPDNAWQFRAGKLRMPFFAYSDGIDVGYSYPWISAPLQVYNNYFFSTFNGASGSYNYAGRSFALNLEAYYGYFDDDIFMAGSKVNVNARVTRLHGIVANLNSHNVGLRLSYHNGYNETEISALDPMRSALLQAGMTSSYNSLESDGDVTFLEAALSYDTLNSFYKTEWIHAKTEFDLAPALTGYYFTAGYLINDWTLHATYAASAYADVKPQQELAVHADNPLSPLYPLANGYYQLFAQVPNGSMDSYTLGARWDFHFNMALKADLTYFTETSPRSGFFAEGGTASATSERQSATLYQLGWEWVF